MKKVRSSPDSSKPQSTSEASAGPPHSHPGDADTVVPAGAAAPLPAPPLAPLPPVQHRSPAQPPGAPGHRGPGEPPVESSEPPPDRPEDPPPLFAMRSDAVLLLAEEEFANVDLTGRKRWTGIELTPKEAELVRTRVAHMEPEAATPVIVRLPKRKKPGEN